MQIRKQWLFSYWAHIFAGILNSLVYFLSDSQQDKILSVVTTTFLILWGWITYHCAYRKRGTAWLKFLLISMPFSMVKSITTSFKKLAPNNPIDLFVFISVLAIYLVIEVWFWLNCKAYWKENQALKSAAQT